MGFFLSTTANVSNNAANGNANAVASGTAQNDVPAISTSNVLMSDSLSSSPTDTNATTTHSRATPASNSLVLTGIAELGLRFAPPEVRRMIFEYTFERRWVDLARQKKLLALFEALRGDQLLYDEAWNIYLEFTTFVINWRRPPRQTCILFQAIRKLEIRFQYCCIFQRVNGNEPFEMERVGNHSDVIERLFSQVSDVVELVFRFPSKDVRVHTIFAPMNYNRMFTRYGICVEMLPRLKKLTISDVHDIGFDWKKNPSALVTPTDIVKFFDDGLGLSHKVVLYTEQVRVFDEPYGGLDVIWQAEEGDVLEFNSRRHATNTMGSALEEFWEGIESKKETLGGVQKTWRWISSYGGLKTEG